MKPEYTLRLTAQEDHPALAALWQKTFGDPPELVAAFFRLLPELGFGVTALLDGRPVGAAYGITAFTLRGRGRCCYLYAVAVEPACRGGGIGAALCRAVMEEGRRRGCSLPCTQPAEESLYGWYRRILDLEGVIFRRFFRVKAAALLPVLPLDAERYAARRRELLAALPGAVLDAAPAALRFEEALCRSCGGGLYAVGPGLAAAYPEDGVCQVRELLLPGKEADAAASLAACLGLPQAVYALPAESGEPYIALPEADAAGISLWNLSFD